MKFKLTLLCLLCAALTLQIAGCKKDSTTEDTNTPCTGCVTTSEGLAAHDSSSAGVYKAVLAGSSGYITFYIMNGSSDIRAQLLFDGQIALLTPTSLSGWQPGQAIDSAEFTGTLGGQQVRAYLTVKANGSSPKVNVVYPGHTIQAIIRKEYSGRVVKIYEGRYTGTDSGAINMIIDGRTFYLINNNGFMWAMNKPDDNLLPAVLVYNGSGRWKIKGHFYTDRFTGDWYGTGTAGGEFALYRTH